MTLSHKLNLSILLTLCLPLLAAVWLGWTLVSRGLDEEAAEALATDRTVAELILRHRLAAFRELAEDISRQQGLALLAAYDVQPKLDRELRRMQEAEALDELRFLPQERASDASCVERALLAETASAGVEFSEGILSVTAVAPVSHREHAPIGGLLLRRSLAASGWRQELDREIRAAVSLSRTAPPDDPAFLTASLPLRDLRGRTVAVLTLRRAKQDYALLQQPLPVFIFAAGLFGLLLALVLRYEAQRMVVRPILALRETADAIGAGAYDSRVSLSACDELNVLGEHINRMAEQVDASWAYCRRANDELEATVERRTEDVQAKNHQLQEALDKLQRSQQRLIAQEKLANLGELSSGISHELKNPLHFIGNFSALLVTLGGRLRDAFAGHEALPEGVEPLLEQIAMCASKVEEHTERALGIISTMLAQSRGTQAARRPCALNPLVKEALLLAYHSMRARCEGFNTAIVEDFDPALEEQQILLASQALHHALVNLLLNACDELWRKQRGPAADFRPELRVETEEAGDEIVIRIRDNGGGISPDIRERIFEPFFSTKAADEGAGLGLSLAQEMTQSMLGGRIELDTQPGLFTEFAIVFPKEPAEENGPSSQDKGKMMD